MGRRFASQDDDMGEAWREYRRAQQQRRADRIGPRTDEILALRGKGFDVKPLTDFQFRIDGKLDLFPIHRSSWIDRCVSTLESIGYEVGAAILPALCVGQDHTRERFYFVGHSNRHGQSVVRVDAETSRLPRNRSKSTGMVPPYGVSRAMAGFGNAIVPQVGQAFIEAYLTVREDAE